MKEFSNIVLTDKFDKFPLKILAMATMNVFTGQCSIFTRFSRSCNACIEKRSHKQPNYCAAIRKLQTGKYEHERASSTKILATTVNNTIWVGLQCLKLRLN